MSDYDINEWAVLGRHRAIQAAAERWEAAGAHCPAGDETRETIRSSVRGERAFEPRQIYSMLIHYREQKLFDDRRAAQTIEMARKMAEQRTMRESMTAEMRAIREQLGLTAAEMDTKLGCRPLMCNNAEKATGSTALNVVASLLARYRIEAKLYGVATVES